MGASLLADPARAQAIVSALRRALPQEKSVSCKIRLLATVDATLEFMNGLVKAGADAISVHLRRVETSYAENAFWDALPQLRAFSVAAGVPVAVNGSVFTRDDIRRIRTSAGDDEKRPQLGVLVARGALMNCSIFRTQADDLGLVLREYLHRCAKFANAFPNTKYTVMRMLQECTPAVRSALGTMHNTKALSTAKTMEDLVHRLCSDADGVAAHLTAADILREWREKPTSAAVGDGKHYSDEHMLEREKREQSLWIEAGLSLPARKKLATGQGPGAPPIDSSALEIGGARSDIPPC